METEVNVFAMRQACDDFRHIANKIRCCSENVSQISRTLKSSTSVKWISYVLNLNEHNLDRIGNDFQNLSSVIENVTRLCRMAENEIMFCDSPNGICQFRAYDFSYIKNNFILLRSRNEKLPGLDVVYPSFIDNSFMTASEFLKVGQLNGVIVPQK